MIRRRLWGYLNEGDVDLPVLMHWSMLPRNGLPCPLHARQIFHTKPESEIHFGSFKLSGVTTKDQATRNDERDPRGGSTGLEHCLRATDYLITSHVTSQPVLSPPRPAIATYPSVSRNYRCSGILKFILPHPHLVYHFLSLPTSLHY